MSKSAHMEAQIIGAVKQAEAGRKAEEVAREMSVSKHTIPLRSSGQRRREEVEVVLFRQKAKKTGKKL